MKVGIISFSEKGFTLGNRLVSFFSERGDTAETTRCENGGLGEWTKAHFFSSDALIFIGSCGIAVRAIAPYVKSKTTDPAVVVMDELGTYAVSLLSGHLGGANELAADLARFSGAIPVITTASERNGVFAFDIWAKKQGLSITNPERIKWVSARLLAGETIRLWSQFPLTGNIPSGISVERKAYDVLVTYKTRGKSDALRFIPPVISLGIGCRKNTPFQLIEHAFEMTLAKANCHPQAVKRVCSIDLKANEPGIREFCTKHKLPFRTFSAQELQNVPGTFASSAFVKSVTGVDNVCERSAVLGSGDGGRLLSGKDAGSGITMALAIEPYTVAFDYGGKGNG